MFILQNIREFIDNPMGRGSNAIPSRQLIKDDLNRRFHALFAHKEKKMALDIYKDKDDYYFHFKVPSESPDRKNTYDVVLQFTVGETPELKSDKNLNRYYLKFFSNSPSFTYTFAYAFNLYGMAIEELTGKFDKQVINNPPITRNPGEVISYEKTIYFAAYYLLEDNKYLNKLIIDSLAKPYKKNDFVKNIRNTDKIELEIKQEKNRVQKLKEKNELAEKENNSRRGNTVSSKRVSAKIGVNSKKNNMTKTSKIQPRKSSITKIKPR